MQFLDGSTHPSQKRVIAVGHGGEDILYPIELYRSLSANVYTVGDINTLLARLSEEDQDKLWTIFKTCYAKVLDVNSDERLVKILEDELAKIQHILSYEDVLRYVHEKDSFWAPPDPKSRSGLPKYDHLNTINIDSDEYGERNANETSLTYTEEDFAEMNALIIYMKLYMPILNHYHSRLSIEHENPIYLFYQVLEVIRKTDIRDSQGYTRLKQYIQDYWDGKETGGLSMHGLRSYASEEIAVDLILSGILFKRVMPIGVSHRHQHFAKDSDRPSLIRSLFHNVQTAVEELTSKRGPEHYMNKDTSGREIGNGDDPSSKSEQYRNVAEHTEQAVATANAFCHNLASVIHHLDPTIPLNLAEDVIYEPNYHLSVQPFRTLMMKWLMNKFVSPSLLFTLDEVAYGNVFKGTVAALQHWGYDDLARTVDGSIDYNSPYESVYDLLPITIEQMKKLDEYYPYTMQTNRLKGDSRRDVNYAARSFHEAEVNIRGRRLRGVNYKGEHGSSVWTCMVDIKYQLANLFIYLNENDLLSVNTSSSIN